MPEDTPTTGARRAYAWVDHLRSGGTVPWRSWRDAAEQPARPGPLPGAQQLELVRRLNLAGRPSAELVDLVLATPGPGRGEPELDLPGAATRDYGRRPVEPDAIPAGELIRVACGVLARQLSRQSPPEAPATPQRRRFRAYRLGGDPWLASFTRDALTDHGRPPGGPAVAGPRVAVLGAELPRLLADAWTYRCFRDGVEPWTDWLAAARRRGRLPARADLARNAAWWSRDRGARVHVLLPPSTREDLSRVTRVRRIPEVRPPAISLPAAELARRTGPVLRTLVPDDDHRRALLRRVLAPRLAALTPGEPPQVPADYRPWLAEQAARQAALLREGDYAVHGDLATLAGPAGSEAAAPGGEPTDVEVLAVAVTTLLDEGER